MATPAPDFSRMCLGRLPSLPDSRTLRLANYTHFPLRPTPVAWVTTPPPARIPIWGNDCYGDCTVAARANVCMVEDLANNREPILNEQKVVQEYFNLTGGADQGLSLLAALKHWRISPFLNPLPLFAFASIAVNDREQIRYVIRYFGTAYIALWMPLAWHSARVWDVGSGRAYVYGSWGGHCVQISGYDENGVQCYTWGQTQLITWAGLARYSNEAYVVLGPDWTDGAKAAPCGLDLETLKNDLAALPHEFNKCG